MQDFNKAKIMLLWYALERKGREHNFEFKGFSFNFYSLGSILEQAKSVWLSSSYLTVSYEGRTPLLDVLHNRLKLRHREQVVQETREVQQEYREGKFMSGSVDDFLMELDS